MFLMRISSENLSLFDEHGIDKLGKVKLIRGLVLIDDGEERGGKST